MDFAIATPWACVTRGQGRVSNVHLAGTHVRGHAVAAMTLGVGLGILLAVCASEALRLSW